MYHHGSDSLVRYEHRTRFVIKDDQLTNSLLRFPEHPQCFYPDCYFQPIVFAMANKLGWCATHEKETSEGFSTILARALEAKVTVSPTQLVCRVVRLACAVSRVSSSSDSLQVRCPFDLSYIHVRRVFSSMHLLQRLFELYSALHMNGLPFIP